MKLLIFFLIFILLVECIFLVNAFFEIQKKENIDSNKIYIGDPLEMCLKQKAILISGIENLRGNK